MIKNLKPRLAEVGKIKIGKKGAVKKRQGKADFRLPVKLDHFLVTTTDKDKNGDFIIDEHVMKTLGQKPTEIRIRLLFDSIDMNFFTSYQYYHGRKCLCRGDGESAVRVMDAGKPNQRKETISCDPETCEFYSNKKCKISGILSCILPDAKDYGGVYRFRTHGFNSVSSILAALTFFKQNTNGILQGLPLKMVFMKKSTEEHGSVPMVTLMIDGVELLGLRRLAIEEDQNRKQSGVNMLMIEQDAAAAGFMVDTDDEADVAQEFYPDHEEQSKPGTSSEELAGALADKKESATAPDPEPEEPETDEEGKKEEESVI